MALNSDFPKSKVNQALPESLGNLGEIEATTSYSAYSNVSIIRKAYGTKYSIMDQIKFVEDSLLKVWMDIICYNLTISLQIF